MSTPPRVPGSRPAPRSQRVIGSASVAKLAALALAGPAATSAQPHTQTELPAVVVTANKQTQSQDRVPGSLTVFDGEDLRSLGIGKLESLAALTPGLSFQAFGQSGVQPPVLRGLSANFTTFSTSTLLLVDGVPTLTAQGFEHNLQNIDRVEVLRGPQSTLYGRNAEAGVISIHSRQPGQRPQAAVSAPTGDRNARRLTLDLSRPLMDNTLFFGVSADWQRQDGFITNTASGRHEDDRERHSARAALRWTPTERTELALRWSRQSFDDGASTWGSVSAPRATVASGTEGWNRSSGTTLAMDLTHRFDGGVALRAITALNRFKDRVRQDTDFQPADMLHIERDYRLSTLSQELRLEGRWSDARWVAGAYADRDDHTLRYEQKLPTALAQTTADLGGDSQALFTHWTLPLDTRWTLTTGGRLERDSVSLSPQVGAARAASWQKFSPKLALQHHWSTDAQVYVSMADGFRAGGFNAFSAAAGFPGYAPETVRAWELGAKGRTADKRLRYSAALYRMDVRTMQVQQIVAPGVVYVTNAAKAHSSGLELQLEALLGGGWQLQAGLARNRTRFEQFRDRGGIYDGNRNPFAPDLQGHLALRYDAPENWFVQGTVSGTGKVYLDAANRHARPGYGLVDLAAGYSSGPWELSAFVRNLADKRYDAVGYLNGTVTAFSPPRSAGLRLQWRL